MRNGARLIPDYALRFAWFIFTRTGSAPRQFRWGLLCETISQIVCRYPLKPSEVAIEC